MTDGTYPFGRPATPRPPRKPGGGARLFVLGVYPSALHVRWEPPTWARRELGIGPIGALAVDDEPTVFWDGADANSRVDAWQSAVGFMAGDGDGEWGHVRAAGNGTSGQSVVDGILEPLGIDAGEVWFTDAVDRFFVKRGKEGTRQQANVMEDVYAPFAEAAALPSASLPLRPSPQALIELAISEHIDRLRAELIEAAAPLVVTLGEEARQVMAALADASGPPTHPLDGQRFELAPAEYGQRGQVEVGGHAAEWLALVHPGQRSTRWRTLHASWARAQDGRA